MKHIMFWRWYCFAVLILQCAVYQAVYAGSGTEVFNSPTVGGRQDSSEMLFGSAWSKQQQQAKQQINASAVVNAADKANSGNVPIMGHGMGAAVVNANTPPSIIK